MVSEDMVDAAAKVLCCVGTCDHAAWPRSCTSSRYHPKARKILTAAEAVRDDREPALVEALRWYQGEADAASRYMAKSDKDETLLAILTVLANDGGRRARHALAAHGTASEEKT